MADEREAATDDGEMLVHEVVVGNAWGDERTVPAETLDVAKAWAEHMVAELADENPEASAPDIDGWSKAPARWQTWYPEGDTEDWVIRIDSQKMKTEKPPEKRVETDGGQAVAYEREGLQQVQSAVASVNENAASAVKGSCGLTTTSLPARELENTHDALLDTVQETRRAVDRVEKMLDGRNSDAGTPTPRQLKDDHAERLRERYEGPVLNLALMLVEQNRREWLHGKSETNGAEQVRRHGLTKNQRSWLDDLADAWRAYDGE